MQGMVCEKLGHRRKEHLDLLRLKLALAGNNETLHVPITYLEIELTSCCFCLPSYILHLIACVSDIGILCLHPQQNDSAFLSEAAQGLIDNKA